MYCGENKGVDICEYDHKIDGPKKKDSHATQVHTIYRSSVLIAYTNLKIWC